MVDFRSRQDRIFDVANFAILAVVFILMAYPIYFVVIASISEPRLVAGGQIILFPRGLNVEGYRFVLRDEAILRGYRNSFLYAAGQAAISLALTIPAAYALARRDFVGRNAIMLYAVFTMYFTGGIIPFYILVRNIGLMNSVFALMLPNAVNVFNLIIARTFFASTIPNELLESAQMDGCTNTRFFLQIVLPLAPAIIAIVILFNVVQNWNAWFHAMLFIRDRTKYPLQLILRQLLLAGEGVAGSSEALTMMTPDEIRRRQYIADLLRYGIIVVAIAPLLILYPFIQRHFVKGIMIGAIKG